MSHTRPPFPDSRAWQRTKPGVLPSTQAVHPATPDRPATRTQPPLQEVLQGLDARELEGETVFDQLFGPKPEGDPRLPRV